MIEPLSISAIVLSITTTIGAIITGIHIKRVNSGCCNCECDPNKSNKNSPPTTPNIIITKQPEILSNILSASHSNLSQV